MTIFLSNLFMALGSPYGWVMPTCPGFYRSRKGRQ